MVVEFDDVDAVAPHATDGVDELHASARLVVSESSVELISACMRV
jgi:hypothetical protein